MNTHTREVQAYRTDRARARTDAEAAADEAVDNLLDVADRAVRRLGSTRFTTAADDDLVGELARAIRAAKAVRP